MNLADCLKIGQIVKAHGIRGEVVADLDIENPDDILELESVFVEINQKLVPFFIDDISVSDRRAIIKFEDFDAVEDTPLVLKRAIYVPFDAMPEPEEGNFYYKEILGFLVKDQSKGEIGKVKDYIERPGQDLLVADYKGKEIYIPVDPSIILKIERRKKTLQVNLPDGLLDL